MKVRWLIAGLTFSGIAGAVVLGTPGAHADLATEERTRCAVRLSVALLGKSPSTELLQSATPQGEVDALLADPAFAERFARFVNAAFNPDPGGTPSEDASYFLAKEIISTGKPWKDMFVGRYNVDVAAGAGAGSNNVQVTADPEGLGYFRSLPWLKRYAGNEPDGYKLVTAYRMMNNVLGLELVASTNAPDADITATGRMAQPCASCHYEGPFALDKVARILTLRHGTGAGTTFSAPPESPQVLLDGQTLSDDEDFIRAMVDSDSFRFRTCRLAYQFLTGRKERTCEAELFDRCMETFATQGTIQSALAVFAKDPSYCE
jgi:hypothetical protein